MEALNPFPQALQLQPSPHNLSQLTDSTSEAKNLLFNTTVAANPNSILPTAGTLPISAASLLSLTMPSNGGIPVPAAAPQQPQQSQQPQQPPGLPGVAGPPFGESRSPPGSKSEFSQLSDNAVACIPAN